LQAAFPLKFSDPEWGVWAGAFFGLYMGHNGKGTGTVLRVGDTVHVLTYRPWDVHLPAAQRLKVFWGGIQWRRRIFDVSMMVCLASPARANSADLSHPSPSLSPTETLLSVPDQLRH